MSGIEGDLGRMMTKGTCWWWWCIPLGLFDSFVIARSVGRRHLPSDDDKVQGGEVES